MATPSNYMMVQDDEGYSSFRKETYPLYHWFWVRYAMAFPKYSVLLLKPGYTGPNLGSCGQISSAIHISPPINHSDLRLDHLCTPAFSTPSAQMDKAVCPGAQ